MTWKRTVFSLLGTTLLAFSAVASQPSSNGATASRAEPAMRSEPTDDAMRVDGEKRFQANCSRCHQYPHKFPPRMILTIERHMRVRALITDEDMRVIIRYLTQ